MSAPNVGRPAPIRAAVIGCGRMGSTIDDEAAARNSPHYPYPWAHAAALYESRQVELVAGADVNPATLRAFGERWGVKALYDDARGMLAEERPDLVCVTTRPADRLDAVRVCAEAGVRAVYATKPLAHRLSDADEMVAICLERGVLFATAAHLNWDPWYEAAMALFSSETDPPVVGFHTSAASTDSPGFPNPVRPLGALRSMVSHAVYHLSNNQSHTLCLFRRFAGAPVSWVVGEMDDGAAPVEDHDLSGSGYLAYTNGVRGVLNSRVGRDGVGWKMDFLGEGGWVSSVNSHGDFEAWALLPGQSEPARLQYPNPRFPRSSMLASVDALATNLRDGTPPACPGDFGREALEVAIALRESHRRGNVPVRLPLEELWDGKKPCGRTPRRSGMLQTCWTCSGWCSAPSARRAAAGAHSSSRTSCSANSWRWRCGPGGARGRCDWTASSGCSSAG